MSSIPTGPATSPKPSGGCAPNSSSASKLNLESSEGKAVEQGIALGAGIPIVGVGVPGSNVFQHLPEYTWVADLDALVEYLTNARRRIRGHTPVTPRTA